MPPDLWLLTIGNRVTSKASGMSGTIADILRGPAGRMELMVELDNQAMLTAPAVHFVREGDPIPTDPPLGDREALRAWLDA